MTDRDALGQDEAMLVSSPSSVHADVAAPSAAHAVALELRPVFDEHHDFVWRSLVHLGVPTSHADDALQEVFLVVHRRLALLLLLYVSLDFANPLMPGAVTFDPSGSVDGLRAPRVRVVG